MRIGVLVGRKADGKCDYLGEPGDIVALDELASKMADEGSDYIKLYIADVTSNPLKTKKSQPKVVAPKAKKSKKSE